MVPVILAPVPSIHIDAALAVPGGTVAFGSGSPQEESSGAAMWEFFKKLDDEGEEGKLPVCIYASKTGKEGAEHRYVGEYVSLIGTYGGSMGADAGGNHPCPSVRPETTLNTDGKWSVFWHVIALHLLEPSDRVPLTAFRTFRNGKPTKTSVGIPRGPIRAFAPDSLFKT